MGQAIISNYKKRISAASDQADKYKKLSNTCSLGRLVVFALLILAVYVAAKLDNFSIIAGSFIVLIFCFAWLVSRQSGFDQRKTYFLNLVKVNENEIASINDHKNIYDNGQRFINEKHPYTSDLDIFGDDSLCQLTNRTATSAGEAKLSEWLKAPASKNEILLRQEAVKELSRKMDWQHGTQAKLLFAIDESADQLKRPFKYLHLPLTLPGERWLVPLYQNSAIPADSSYYSRIFFSPGIPGSHRHRFFSYVYPGVK